MPKNYRLVSPKEFNATSIRSRGYLPHWDRDGSVFFITYRLADALPREVVERLQQEREAMLQSFSRGVRQPTNVEVSQVSRDIGRRLEMYLDRGAGCCFLRNPSVTRIIVDNLRHFDPERYELFAFCVMPNHVHVVMRKNAGWHLDQILHSWKSYTSKKAQEVIGRQPFFWQRDYFDHTIRDEEEFWTTIKYVINNPAAGGLKDWPWVWSKFGLG